MKKILIALLVIGIIVTGCGTNRKASKSDRPEKPEETSEDVQELKRELDVWEGQFPIQYNDPISFFNEFEISTVASKSDYIYKMENGLVKKIPSSKFAFTVPAETSGVISKMGITDAKHVSVSFFKDSDTYVTFTKRQGLIGFYTEAKATVYVDKIPYSVDIIIKGKGDGKCRLLFDLQEEANPDNEDKVATGIVPEGTKEIVPK